MHALPINLESFEKKCVSFVFFSRFLFSTYFANNGLGLQYVWNLGSFYPIYHLFITAFGTSKKKTFNVRCFWFSYFYSRSHSKVVWKFNTRWGWCGGKKESIVCLFEVKILLQSYHLQPFSNFQHLGITIYQFILNKSEKFFSDLNQKDVLSFVGANHRNFD